jgi:hypothetical protein
MQQFSALQLLRLIQAVKTYCDFRVKSTPTIHPDSLANLGTLHQQNLARLNVGSTLLSFTLPLLMLQSTLIMLHSRLIMLAHAWQ